jgi:hypothetical protein
LFFLVIHAMNQGPIFLCAAMLVALLLSWQPATIQNAYQSAERPVVNLPVQLRQSNWLGGPRWNGSCAWASLVMSCNWANEIAKAERIRAAKGGGVSVRSFCQGMTAEGIPYLYTYGKNDVAFLEKALASRRPVIVGVDWGSPYDKTEHAVLLTHLDEHSAALLDNNRPQEDLWMTRNEFLQEWEDTDSFAVVVLYSPVPPLAHN